MLLAMRYKSFVWPNNPATCSLTVRRDTVIHKYPGERFAVEDLGVGQRLLTGTGEFYGGGAYIQMKLLLQVFEEDGPGQLLHPVIELQQAYFTELELLQEPREGYVAYRFTFQEDGGARAEIRGGIDSVTANRYHTVQPGESLWEIAAANDTTVAQLMAINAWISNPNVLATGGQVRLS